MGYCFKFRQNKPLMQRAVLVIMEMLVLHFTSSKNSIPRYALHAGLLHVRIYVEVGTTGAQLVDCPTTNDDWIKHTVKCHIDAHTQLQAPLLFCIGKLKWLHVHLTPIFPNWNYLKHDSFKPVVPILVSHIFPQHQPLFEMMNDSSCDWTGALLEVPLRPALVYGIIRYISVTNGSLCSIRLYQQWKKNVL